MQWKLNVKLKWETKEWFKINIEWKKERIKQLILEKFLWSQYRGIKKWK